MRLAHEIEEGAVAPFGRRESLVGRIIGNERRLGLAGEPAQRIRKQAEKTRRQRRLRLDGARGIGEPVLGHLADRADGGLQLIGKIGRLFALLGRLQRGGQRLAALLDEPRHIIGDAFEIGLRRVGVGGQFGKARRQSGKRRMQDWKAGRDGGGGRCGSRCGGGRRHGRFDRRAASFPPRPAPSPASSRS